MEMERSSEMERENGRERGLIVEEFLKKGYLISPDFFEEVCSGANLDLDVADEINSRMKSKDRPLVLNKELISCVSNNGALDINWIEFERSRVLMERGRNRRMYQTFLDLLRYHSDAVKREELNKLLEDVRKDRVEVGLSAEREREKGANVIVLKSFLEKPKKMEIGDFVEMFRERCGVLTKLLQGRQEMKNLVSINRVKNKGGNEEVSVVGLVFDIQKTKTGNLILVLEDVSGSVRAFVNKGNKQLGEIAGEVCFDEVIGLVGHMKNGMLFVSKILFPECMINEVKKTEEEVYAAFISDVHVGSKMFLREEFLKFLKWLRGEAGDEKQREIAKKVKYLFVIGDLVDGVGVYPEQQKDLEIEDLREQYKECARLFSMIREDINTIVCPGQHDAVRIGQPQPSLDKEYAEELCGLKNLIMVSNPAMVNVHSSKDFSGFNVLMYHGASFHYYVSGVDSLRENMARDNPRHILKFLLQKRHLAPSHTSTPYIPYKGEDPLVISKAPDIFVCGDMHRSDVSAYNNIILINCSCWQAKTAFQEKTGNNPDPGKVPLLNLKTREVKMMNFFEE